MFCLVHIKKRPFLTSSVFGFVVSLNTSSHLCSRFFDTLMYGYKLKTKHLEVRQNTLMYGYKLKTKLLEVRQKHLDVWIQAKDKTP